MSATALLKFAIDAVDGPNGQAAELVFSDLPKDVIVKNSNNTGVGSWQLDLLYSPPGATQAATFELAFADDGLSPLNFTLHVNTPGSWRLVLKVWNGANRTGAPTDIDIRNVLAKTSSGFHIPPPQVFPLPLPTLSSGLLGAKPNEVNLGGREDLGWSGNDSDGLLNHLIRSFGVVPYIDPRLTAYGAIGNGIAIDNTAILAAITAGIAANKPVNGFGKTYGIAGNLTLPDSAWLENIKFKQLTPDVGTVRTLTSAEGSNIHLVRVTVDRNGSGANGAHQVDAGVHIEGGSNHYLENVEVFGDDIGSGIALVNVTDSWMVKCHVHDIKYLLASDPGNDRVQGIWLSGCTNVKQRDCHTHEIGGDFGGGYTLRWSRGFCYNGNIGTRIWGCESHDVDQGYDITGSVGNTRFVFDHCSARDCMVNGFKFANTARDGQVNNCTAERIGLWGFVASGPSGAGMTGLGTSDIQFTACVAYDTGGWSGPGTPVGGTKAGFRVMYAGFEPDTLLGIRFLSCKAHDRQSSPTMAYGFLNDIDANIDGRYNEAVDCVSIGHTTAAFYGMHAAHCEVSRAAVQSIPDNAWTAVDWTADVDRGAMHSTSSNNNAVFARRAGRYLAQFGVVFAANGSGQRGVRILRNGGVVVGTTILSWPAVGGQTSMSAATICLQDEGDSLSIEVFQDSGGNLDLQTTSGGVVEQVA